MKARIRYEYMQLPLKAFYVLHGELLKQSLPSNQLREMLNDDKYIVRFKACAGNISELEYCYESDDSLLPLSKEQRDNLSNIVSGDLRDFYDTMPENIKLLPPDFLKCAEEDPTIIDRCYFTLQSVGDGGTLITVREIP